MEFMNALSSCSDLRTLRINMHGPDATSMELVFDIAVRLEHLTIIGNCKGFPTSLSKWPCFPNLKELELKVGRNVHLTDQLEIIRRCPALVGLTWRLPDRVNYPISDICDLFRTHCRFIERLGLPFGSMSDQDLFRIVQSGCRFTRFQFPRTRVGQWAFQSMAGHFASLQELDLGDCGLLTSQMAQRIMTGCPNLISFWGVSLNARDILGISRGDGEATGQGGSESTTEEQQQQQQQQAPKWVCTQLRILSIFIFGFAGEPQDWYRRVLEQLSRLTKLETLAVGSGWSSPDGLDLRLETGLGVLSTLTELQEFRFEGLSQKMEEQDVRWMVEAWPKLRLVKGKLHQDRRQRLKMIHILTDKKVQAPFSDADNDSSDDEDSNYNDDSDNGDAASTAGDASGAVVDLYPSIAGLGSFEDPNTSEDSDVAVVLRHRHRVRI
ncbi:hypothetical protein BGX31_011008 [Mortierella sp. GBA43]|nr:hypothetical protein BGX31_011008 [Mortierella sp. GBA43]